MALYAKGENVKSFDPVPAGIHAAICTAVFDLGTQYSEKFQKSSRKVLVQWELPAHRIVLNDKDTGEERNLPMATSKQYTLSLHEKATLRKELEGWRGKAFAVEELEGFDILKLLGVNCQVQIIHNKTETGTYANVNAVFPLPKDQWKEPENPLRFFSFDEDHLLPDGVPNWIVEIIHKSEEWKIKMHGPQDTGSVIEEEPPYDKIPF